MAMDIAQRVELALLEKQKPMNAVMERGDSAVQQFYRDAVVLVTGGSGFLGKQLVEKLFRSCEIKKIYLLLRPKKGKSIEQRLAYILKDPLYDTLRKTKPNFADCIVPVEGDVATLRAGLSEKDWNNITSEVNIIFHMAATVNFDEPLQVAGLTNVRGTREMLTLSKQCHNLKLFNHISTAFAHATNPRINSDIKEQFYPCPIPPDVFLEMVDSLSEDRLTSMTPALIKDWPNTYTFTKAIAEELVRTHGRDLPVCIVKPPVVINSFVEPSPGWIDNQTVMASPIGFLLGAALGVLHALLVNRDLVVSYAPLDYVNNAIIAAGWDSVTNRKLWSSEIPMYTVSSSPYTTKWGVFGDLLRTDEFRRLSTPRCLWYNYLIETNSSLLYWLLTWFLHYIPGYFLDAVVSLLGVRPKGVPSLVKVYTKVYKLTMVYRYFLSNYWNFRDDNVQSMISRLSPADRAIYNCDVSSIETRELVQASCVGVRRSDSECDYSQASITEQKVKSCRKPSADSNRKRKMQSQTTTVTRARFILKDGLQGSDAAYRKQKWLYYANIIFLAVYAYLIWRVLYFVYSTIALVFNV